MRTFSRSDSPPDRRVPCPTCGEMALFSPQNRWRPFCSERCRGVDLGAWAAERYRVAASDTRSDDGADDPSTAS